MQSEQHTGHLVDNRKFVSAYYTTIPSATLLAGLVLDASQWENIDWSSIEDISNFIVSDPACGAGALLVAAYQQIFQNYKDASSDSLSASNLHRVLIEHSIHGADIVDTGVSLTISALAAMNPNVKFKKANVDVLPIGIDDFGKPRVGSLDWINDEHYQYGFEDTNIIPRPKAQVVIANPPYRRSGSHSGKLRRVFGHKQKEEKLLAKTLSDIIKNTPANQVAGLASAFIVLADRMIQVGGRIAFILPGTFLQGTSWSDVRKYLSENYQVEYIVSYHDTTSQSMSYDTRIQEVMLVAKKLSDKSKGTGRCRFVNLWKQPNTQSEAFALANVIRSYSNTSINMFDGPAVGGTDIMFKNNKWGEIIDAPIGELPWAGGTWKNVTIGQFFNSLTHDYT